MPRKPSSALTRFTALIALVTLAATSCTDRGVTDPVDPDGKPTEIEGDVGATAIRCTVTVRTRTMTCASPTRGAIASRPATTGRSGAGAPDAPGVTMGTPYILLQSPSVVASGPFGSPGTIDADVTVTNNIDQPIGTENGTDPGTDAVMIFIEDLQGTGGTVTVNNATGTGTFISDPVPFFKYNEVVQPDATSSAMNWEFGFDAGVTTFSFTAYVFANVEFPDGYVTPSDAASLELALATAETVDLSLFSPVGNEITTGITWGSDNEAVATVNPTTGVVTPVSNGSANITGTAGSRNGTVQVVVDNNGDPSASNDTYDAISGVFVGVLAENGVLANDSDTDDTNLTVNLTDDVDNGDLTLNADGSFAYMANPGFSGSDSFTYTVSDPNGGLSGFATVTLNVPTGFYFVDVNDAGSLNQGSQDEPFNTAGIFSDLYTVGGSVDATGDDVVLVAPGSYTGGFTMIANATIMGPDQDDDIDVVANGDTYVLLSASGTANVAGQITVANNNTIDGISITNATGTVVSGTAINGVSLNRITTSGAIVLTNAQGTLGVTNSALTGGTGSSGRVLVVSNSSAITGNLTVSGNEFIAASLTGGFGAIELSNTLGGTLNVDIDTNQFPSINGRLISALYSTGTNTVDITNNVANNTASVATTGGGNGGITLTANTTANVTYLVDGNTINRAHGAPISIGSAGTAVVTGTVSDNILGTEASSFVATTANSAIILSVTAAGATHTARASGNDIHGFTAGNNGLRLLNTNGTGNFTVNNNLSWSGGALSAIALQYTVSAGTGCLNFGGAGAENDFSNSGTSNDVAFTQTGGTANVVGFDTNAATTATNRNNGTWTGTTTGTFNNVGSCTTP